MTVDLEHVVTGDGIERNFAKLMRAVPDMGGKSVGVRFGSGTVTWPGGSRLTSTLDVPHGLGKAPVAVLLTSKAANMTIAQTAAPTSTVFRVQGNTADGSSPVGATTQDFYWIAIG